MEFGHQLNSVLDLPKYAERKWRGYLDIVSSVNSLMYLCTESDKSLSRLYINIWPVFIHWGIRNVQENMQHDISDFSNFILKLQNSASNSKSFFSFVTTPCSWNFQIQQIMGVNLSLLIKIFLKNYTLKRLRPSIEKLYKQHNMSAFAWSPGLHYVLICNPDFFAFCAK